MLECVVNVSEGRRTDVVEALGAAAGPALLDVHTDPHHHRTVLTLLGEDAARRVVAAAVDLIDLRRHHGVHPRLGAADVVPFVALGSSPPVEAVAARDRFVTWMGEELGVPAFAYGGGGPDGEPTLPEVRRGAFRTLRPGAGPGLAHPTAGAAAVGARPLLVAYNVWLAGAPLAEARRVAVAVRGPAVRAIGLAVGGEVQVSMNLVDPVAFGPEAAFDAVARLVRVARAELVGLVPRSVLEAVDPARWAELDLDPDRTIEARVAAARGD